MRHKKLAACLALGSAIALISSAAKATPINLGVDLHSAEGYAVFALNNFTINGPGTINGNIAIGQSATLTNPAVINGTAFVNTGGSVGGNSTPTGGIQTMDLSQAISDAKAAAVAANALTGTQNLGALTNNPIINADPSIVNAPNVIDVSQINLTNGNLTINGTSTETFVINDSGDFTTSNTGMVLTGGVTAANILFNIKGNLTITGGGGNTYFGTFLAPNSSITVHDKTLNGELIGNMITDTSGFSVNNVPLVPLPAPLWGCLAVLGGFFGWRQFANRRVTA